MKKYYLFDFDGTLVDSMPIWAEGMVSVLKDHGIPYPDDIIKTIVPLGSRGTAEYFVTLGVPKTADEILEIIRKTLTQAYVAAVPAKQNVKEALTALRARGDSLNVLTASPHSMLDPCLKRLGMWELFDNIWSCDDFDTTKVDPKIYRRAAEKMGCGVEKLIFLDDNQNADRAAKQAGAYVIGVYDNTSADAVEQMKSVCDDYIYDFSELI